MDYTYILIKFLIGGGVIVGVTLLAEQVNPKYGGILVAAPIITSLAILFTWSEAGQATSRQAGDRGVLVCHPDPALPPGALSPHGTLPAPSQFWRGPWYLACGHRGDEQAPCPDLKGHRVPGQGDHIGGFLPGRSAPALLSRNILNTSRFFAVEINL